MLPIELDKQVYAKLEHMWPTGSYKDRGVQAMVSQLSARGVSAVVSDSSGNAGASLAAYGARAGMQVAVYVPETTSPGKLRQIRAYGAELIPVAGTRTDCELAAQQDGRTYVGHNWNPWFLAALRGLAQQIVDMRAGTTPEWVVVPVGAGTLALGLAQGFVQLHEGKVVERVPRILAVQSEQCAPFFAAWSSGATSLSPVPSRPGLAEGLAIGRPVRGPEVLRAVRNSGGSFSAVTDSAIRESAQMLAHQGLYVEPSSAVAAAGLRDALQRGLIRDEDDVVLILTGSGLKPGSDAK